MEIQQIRNATLKINYGGKIFLLDPWLQDKGTGFTASTVKPEMEGIKNPLNELPFSPEEILKNVDYCLVTHFHPDHFTPDYLPKDIHIITANKIDKAEIEKLGFKNVSILDNKDLNKELIGIEIKKTPAVHGNNEEIALKMGDVSGYYLTGEKDSLYIAGDTVLNEEIEDFLIKNKPNVIILNCAEATMPKGRLIMNLDEVKTICNMCPKSTVILTHLDSVNHALVTSKDAREFINKENLKNAIVLKNGECLKI